MKLFLWRRNEHAYFLPIYNVQYIYYTYTTKVFNASFLNVCDCVGIYAEEVMHTI